MVPVFRGEDGESAPVEVYAAIVEVVRVFFLFHPGSHEIDFPVSFVHEIDFANHKFAPGKLSFHFSAFPVYQIEVAPAVPFRQPKHFCPVVDVVTVVVDI